MGPISTRYHHWNKLPPLIYSHLLKFVFFYNLQDGNPRPKLMLKPPSLTETVSLHTYKV